MEKVKSYIDANKERFLEELFDLLRIPSISAQSEHKPDMVRCAEWLAASLVKAGADRAEDDAHRRQSRSICREDHLTRGKDRAGVWPLRCDAR